MRRILRGGVKVQRLCAGVLAKQRVSHSRCTQCLANGVKLCIVGVPAWKRGDISGRVVSRFTKHSVAIHRPQSSRAPVVDSRCGGSSPADTCPSVGRGSIAVTIDGRCKGTFPATCLSATLVGSCAPSRRTLKHAHTPLECLLHRPQTQLGSQLPAVAKVGCGTPGSHHRVRGDRTDSGGRA